MASNANQKMIMNDHSLFDNNTIRDNVQIQQRSPLATLCLRFKINLNLGKTPRNRFILNLPVFINQSRHKSLISLT